MQWDVLQKAWRARLLANDELAALFGEKIGPISVAQKVAIPSLQMFRVSDVEEESFNPILVQIDFWARGVPQADRLERLIRQLSHRKTSQSLDGIPCWILYREARDVEYVAEPGVVHRQLDFEVKVLSEMYMPLTEDS